MLKILYMLISLVQPDGTVLMTPHTDVYCISKESVMNIYNAWDTKDYQASSDAYDKASDCNAFPIAAVGKITETFAHKKLLGANKDWYEVWVVSAVPVSEPDAKPIYLIIANDTNLKDSSI
jgi:hypothetical protein